MSITISPNSGLSQRLRLNGSRALSQTQRSLERLSTGKRINRASDDPAGLIAAEQVRTELTDVKAELKNYGRSRLALNQRGSQLATMRRGLGEIQGRVVEAASSVATPKQRDALQIEVEGVLDQFERLDAVTTSELLDLRSGGGSSLDAGDPVTAAELVRIETGEALGQQVRTAVELRGLDTFEQIARDREIILSETLSQIEDTDFAEEASNLATSQALTSAANAAVAYSRQSHADLIGGLLDKIDIDPKAV